MVIWKCCKGKKAIKIWIVKDVLGEKKDYNHNVLL